MKFLIDAQLPWRMVNWLSDAGCDALHTRDLPDGNQTTDNQLCDLAEQEQRIVITKDADFVDSHLLHNRPPKLLLITLGNMSNDDLEQTLTPVIPEIVQEFVSNHFLELNRSGLAVRG